MASVGAPKAAKSASKGGPKSNASKTPPKRVSNTGSQRTSTLSARDVPKANYSEEGDLPEPDEVTIEQEIAAEIEQEITGCNLASVELTLVRELAVSILHSCHHELPCGVLKSCSDAVPEHQQLQCCMENPCRMVTCDCIICRISWSLAI